MSRTFPIIAVVYPTDCSICGSVISDSGRPPFDNGLNTPGYTPVLTKCLPVISEARDGEQTAAAL